MGIAEAGDSEAAWKSLFTPAGETKQALFNRQLIDLRPMRIDEKWTVKTCHASCWQKSRRGARRRCHQRPDFELYIDKG
jgi:hypothetical protein